VHHIQRKILAKLLYAESLTYSQMRPVGVESNHFAYHLEQLVHDGVVNKKDKQYFLTPEGLSQVDRLSQEKMVDRVQPHILTVIDITNAKGETLLFKRAFQPYIYKFGFPLGKTHLEETVETAAVRELQEKTGLDDIPLVQRGIVYVHVKQRDVTITKALCHVFSGQVKEALAVNPPLHRGSCYWEEVSTLPTTDFMPGFLDIKKLLQNDKPGLFFAELTYEY
jgi:ADP-ribose pyrophosphatase YjhB (NUDIX family)